MPQIVKKIAKGSLWALFVGTAVVGVAAPKVLPLIKSEPKAAPGQGAANPDGKRQNGGSGAALKVSTFVVQPTAFAETITSTGSLRAEEGVELQAETNGKVVAINFTEGGRVRKGDLLLKLNDADLRATLARTQYTVDLAKLKEQRYAQLIEKRVVTQNDYDIAISDLHVQQANVELYQAQIEKTEIRAPFDGVVGLRYVSMGAYVNADTRIATLQRVDRLKIDFAIPEKYVGRVQAGAPITFNIAGGERKFTGRIYAIDPQIDAVTRSLVLRAECDNADGRLLPGAFANIELTLERLDNAVLIPAEAVVPGLDEKNVFVMQDGKAERRPVQTGTRTSSRIHVLAGLAAGDVVITSGLQQLRPGQAVAALDDAGKGVPRRANAAGSPGAERT